MSWPCFGICESFVALIDRGTCLAWRTSFFDYLEEFCHALECQL